jgi:hypothetical protein
MLVTYTYTAEKVTCPYPSCQKRYVGPLHNEFPMPGTVKCPHCGRPYTIEIAKYKTTTVDQQ